MEEWPFNEKGLWQSLQPGQKWAVILGIPIIFLMLRQYSELVSYVGNKIVEVVLLFAGFFLVPWVYAAGLGLVIGVIIEVLFYRNRRR